ncbi:MAG: T9SS type A sorting domain-containing protein, partial [Bacteroidota bacterium]
NLNITCNKICNNTFYNLQHGRNFGSNSNISNNYWCTTDSALIASKIYDGYDNINFGLVSFIPVDTTQCYLTGCNLSITSTITNATCDTCRNGSAMAAVAFGSLPLTYTWNSSPLQTTQIATNLAPGNYTICVIDAIGCTACSTVFIDSSNCGGFSVAAQATNATCNACSDGSAQVNVTGGAPPYSYTWYTSPIQTSATAVGMSQGTYSVCVNDLHGCAVCDTVTISIGNCSAHFNLYPDSVPHNYTAVNMASGNGPLTYLWSWGDGATDTGPYPRHTYASAGFYAICLSITDSVGCTNSYCNNFYLQRNTNAMVNVNVIPGISTDISAIRNPQSSFLLSPNPANSSVTISIDESMIGGTVTVMDLMGRKMLAVQLVTGNQQLATDNLSSGVYFVEVVSKGGRVVKQLMKQ